MYYTTSKYKYAVNQQDERESINLSLLATANGLPDIIAIISEVNYRWFNTWFNGKDIYWDDKTLYQIPAYCIFATNLSFVIIIIILKNKIFLIGKHKNNTPCVHRHSIQHTIYSVPFCVDLDMTSQT